MKIARKSCFEVVCTHKQSRRYANLLCSDCYKPWIRDAGKVLDYHNVIETGLKNKWTNVSAHVWRTPSQDFLDTCEREL